MKRSGVLLPLASLSSPYLIGDFGPDAYRFGRYLRSAGFSYWQILPLQPLGYGNSPYQCTSSKAIEESYVSPELLKKDGLIAELPKKTRCASVRYEEAKQLKRALLKEAFMNYVADEDYRAFAEQDWVKDYAAFACFKELFERKCWLDWEEPYRSWSQDRDPALVEKHKEAIDFEIFVQYILRRQFNALKDYLHSLGIELIGDMPFYVGIDSADVYFDRGSFCLDKDGYPVWIAGVPPDYFSATGQRWGNPIYDWKKMKKDGYAFWFDRLHSAAEMYDVIRIDHFRAFDTYWKIPAAEKTAIVGEWIVNDGDDFFTRLFDKYPDLRIIAEDLGDLRPEVLELRDRYHLPGMRVIQFDTFSPFRKHQVTYLGTHDNDATLAWYAELDKKTQKKILRCFRRRYPGMELRDAFLAYALDAKSELVVLSVNDITGDTRRINTPGTTGSPDWEYKLTSLKEFREQIPFLKERNRLRGENKR
ncbi:MAG: 4-alpha-glucanotransferase [Erysipelotrichaceae bacterium]|nr:4-alpha-glucanotransferase [Erysipelotrichaceae bacterium]